MTYMAGRNDEEMTTGPADAVRLVDAASARGLGYVGFWALARDHGGCPGTEDEADDCSGIVQEPWRFTRLTQAFART